MAHFAVSRSARVRQMLRAWLRSIVGIALIVIALILLVVIFEPSLRQQMESSPHSDTPLHSSKDEGAHTEYRSRGLSSLSGISLSSAPPPPPAPKRKQAKEQKQLNRLRALSQMVNMPTQLAAREEVEEEADEPNDGAFLRQNKTDADSFQAIPQAEPEPDSMRGILGMSGRGELRGLLPTLSSTPVKPLAFDDNEALDDAVSLEMIDQDKPIFSSDFLHTRHNTQALDFKEATGYWTNTYVPGDPLLRRLHVRLKRQKLNFPDQTVQTLWQPFDPPQQAAMALYLNTDKRAVQGATRLLLQIGLKGTARHSGRRSAMNVGLVLDLRGDITPHHSTLMRALLQAFVQARQSDDQFILTIVGRPGGVLLSAEDFRHGPMSLALPHLFGDAPPPNNTSLNLTQAIDATAQQLKHTDTPSASLGSSLLILITDKSLGTHAATLQEQAHQYATQGIPFSAIGIGQGLEQEALEELVVLGQGHLRLLDRSSDAVSLVDRELHAVSRVVARALRLNIRLQPGVKLINIPGSQRLDLHRSEQMRQAERSIDQRLAKNLGIAQDRGSDDDGIQIVIPAFYANDSHVILLDVLAEKPGQLAEVSLRYKDLVYLRNGVSRTALNVGREVTPAGPLELNVWKNLLALQLADTVKQAGTQLEQAQKQQAIALLNHYQTVLKQVQNQVLAWQQDQELQQDQHMLQRYVQLLHNSAPQQLPPIADSLQYAGFAKVLSVRHGEED